MRTLGETLFTLRTARGWSQRRLAREAGLSQPVVNSIERGHATRPSAETIRKLARALNTSADELLVLPVHITPEMRLQRALEAVDRSIAHLGADARRQVADIIRRLDAEERRQRGDGETDEDEQPPGEAAG